MSTGDRNIPNNEKLTIKIRTVIKLDTKIAAKYMMPTAPVEVSTPSQRTNISQSRSGISSCESRPSGPWTGTKKAITRGGSDGVALDATQHRGSKLSTYRHA